MNCLDDQLKQNINNNSREKRSKPRTQGVETLVLVLLWGGLVFGGFYLTKQYMDKALQNVQQTNAMSVQAINESLEALSSDMEGLKEVLISADKTISTTGSLQQNLTEKIRMLEEQMQDLEASLKVLKEAPNGSR